MVKVSTNSPVLIPSGLYPSFLSTFSKNGTNTKNTTSSPSASIVGLYYLLQLEL